MTSRSGILLKLVFGATLLCGCQAYRYMRDVTPEVEASRREYVDTNPGNRYNDDITTGQVRTGMSRLQVHVTWGDPDRVSRGAAAGGRAAELWSYEEADESRGQCVYVLRFTGEILQDVTVQRVNPELRGDDNAKNSDPNGDKAIRQTSGVKPGSR
jgi:hypothetical protein